MTEPTIKTDVTFDTELESDLPSTLYTIPPIVPATPWYVSKRFLATMATIIQGALLTFWGIDLAPEDQAQLIALLGGIGTTATGAIALYGVITAKRPVQFRKPKE